MAWNWWLIGSMIFVVFVVVKIVSVRSFLRWWKHRDSQDVVIHDDHE